MISFIHCWKKQVPDNICEDIISIFEDIIKKYPDVISRGKLEYPNTNMQRKDVSIDLNDLPPNVSSNYPIINQLCEVVYEKIYECYSEYKMQYGQLAYGSHEYSTLKVQRTMPYGGFHTLHYEKHDTMDAIRRELVWTIYLNTMPQNEAETEFLYQAVKLQPQKGMVCIFPAGMTHVHRGLTVYTQPKYIMTGWFLRKLRDNEG